MARHKRQRITHKLPEPIEPKSWPKRVYNLKDLRYQKALTSTQAAMFENFSEGNHVIAYGTAGTGKSFVALYLALQELLSSSTPISKLIIIRSAVQGRALGHMPGTLEEKIAVYEAPYKEIVHELTGSPSAYDDMKAQGQIQFGSTSFLRGLTWNNAIVIVDEGQNLDWHEINTVMTRVGDETILFFLGDVAQADLRHDSGFERMLRVTRNMMDISQIEFTRDDIVRSAFVRDWIVASEDNP